MRATPTGSAIGSGASAAAPTVSISFSAFSAIGSSRPAGSRLRRKMFGIAVMTWKCFECGSRLRKISGRVACVQKPARATQMRTAGDSPANIAAKRDPMGAGKIDHAPCQVSSPMGARMVVTAAH
jgi:hypothetical protein